MARSFFSRSLLALPAHEGRRRIIGLLIIFLILFSPLDSETAGGLYPFTVLSLASIALLALLSWNALRSRGEILPLNSVTITYIPFLAWCVLSLAWTIDRPATEYGIIRILSSLVILISVAATFRDEEDYLTLFRAAVLCGGVLSMLGLAQFFLPIGRHGSRAHSLFVTPNSFAGLLLLLLPLALALALRTEERRRRLWTAAAFLMAAAFLASGSRGAWLALAGAACVLAGILRRSLPAPAAIADALRRRRAVSLVAVLIVAVIVSQGLRTGEMGERFRSLKAPLSAEPDRYRYWESTLDIARERPLLGYGLRTFHFLHPGHRSPLLDERVLIAYSHNDYLQMAAETGIAGLALFLALSIAVGLLALRGAHRSRGVFAPAAALGLLAVMLHSIVDFNFHIPAIQVNFWVLAAFLMTVGNGNETPQRTLSLDTGWSRGIALVIIAVTAAAAAGTVGRHLLAERASTEGFRTLAGGDFTGARERFKRAARLVPYSSFYIANLGRVDAAEGEQRREKTLLERAEGSFRRALAENPYDHKSHLLLALMLARNLNVLGEEKREDLVEVLRNGVARHPRERTFTLQLARVLLGGGRPAEAIPLLERYLSSRPDDGGLRLLFAEALLRSGDPAGARREAERLLAANPEDEKAAALIERSIQGAEK